MSKVRVDRDLVLRIKLLLPEKVWRAATVPASAALRMLPDRVKYSWGMEARRKRYPYAAIRENDYVMQIGAPSDLLAVGRSRSAYFLHMVSGIGKLIVMEPDQQNCDRLQAFADRNGLTDRLIVIPKGGWHREKTLRFYQSRSHPASAVLEELNDATPQDMKRRGYEITEVPVTTVDAVLAEHNLPIPRLVSITTNGAEVPILEGMSKTLETPPEYISLAITRDGYTDLMPRFGYDYFADDDRGFTFKSKASGGDQASA